jgi:4a-hydroxytetrahydrobiopterin dehydratase
MWVEKNNSLYKQFLFKNFTEAFAFLSTLAFLMEKHDHHATIHNTYNKVELWLNTHDAGNTITEKDRTLAAAIDQI